jgi:L-ascorbate metabolism protein UlaG (beta-lactamase superfamily)
MNKMKQVTAPETRPITAEAFEPNNVTTLYWLASAGFLINAHGTLIIIDPSIKTKPGQPRICDTGLKMLVDYPIDSADIPKMDAVLYSHADEDHIGDTTAKDLSRLNPLMIGPAPVFCKLVKLGVSPSAIKVCRSGDQFTIGCVTIDITPADHPWQLRDPIRFGKPWRADDCCGFMLTTPGGKLFFPGDTRLMEEHLSLKGVDVLALDTSLCVYHLSPTGAIALANSMPDALVIPYHYGTYDDPEDPAYCGDPADVLSKVTRCESRVRILAPGEPFSIKDGSKCW